MKPVAWIKELLTRKKPWKRVMRWVRKPERPGPQAKRAKRAMRVAKRRAAWAFSKERWKQRRQLLEKHALYKTVWRRSKKRQRQRLADEQITFTPGDPHWGGSDDIFEEVIEPLVRKHRGKDPHSAKRWACYGNCDSDHHKSQVLASARDWALVNDHAMLDIIARAVVGRSVSDYEIVTFEYGGRTFRFQGIAGTHGTGPHLHVGIERIS